MVYCVFEWHAAVVLAWY